MDLAKRIVFFLIVVSNVFSVRSNDIKFTHITKENGLSNSTIISICQDNRGFMWFGSEDGLNKYDGYKVTVYYNDIDNINSLSDNHINCIFEDSKNRLWIGTANHANTYNRDLDSFIRYPSGKDHVPNSDFINTIFEDSYGNIWLASNLGLSLFNEEAEVFERLIVDFEDSNDVLNQRVTSIYEDENAYLWIGTEIDGIYILDRKGVIKHIYSEGNEGLLHNNISVITQDKERNIWIGTVSHGLNMMSRQDSVFLRFTHNKYDRRSISSNAIKCIGYDKKGNMWIGTENGGLNLWDETSRSFIHYENDPSNWYSISQKTVAAFYNDNQDNIWLGTHRGGVNLYSLQSYQFDLYTQGESNTHLSYKNVRCFYEDTQGRIFVGTDGGGLNIWNRGRNEFVYYRHNQNNNSIGSDAVLTIVEDEDSCIWIGTWGGGLNRFYPQNGNFKRYLHNPHDLTSIGSNNVSSIVPYGNNKFLVGTIYGGLNIFDKTTGFFSKVSEKVYGAEIAEESIYTILADEDANFWFSSGNGKLYRFNQENGESSLFTFQSSSTVNVIFIDSKRRIWVGQRGLFLFDKQGQIFCKLESQHDFSSETVQSIEEDEIGNLWIGTGNGLIRYNPDTDSYKKFTTSDGLQGLEFERSASIKTRRGELVFGGYNGFNIFEPDRINQNVTPPPVYLIDFQISYQSIKPTDENSPLTKDISVTDRIILKYSQSVFSIEYVALNYIKGSQNQYAYMLEGFDDEWRYVGDQRKASFSNLNPGEYVFRVKASNNDGIWNEKGASVIITILPPFWMTWWFRALLGVIILFLLFQIYRYIKKRINKQRMEELHLMQSQFFTNVSHELRTPLSIIYGSLEKLEREYSFNTYFASIKNNIERLTLMVDELINFRKVESGFLDLNVSRLSVSELSAICTDFHTYADQRKIDFNVSITGINSEVWLDKQIVEKILNNLLSNAFKYTNVGGSVTLTISCSKEALTLHKDEIAQRKSRYKALSYIYFVVSDTGIGITKESARHLFRYYYRISEAHMGSGIGLAFVKGLTYLHKGYIKVYSRTGEGSDFILALPCSKNDYSSDEFSGKEGRTTSKFEENLVDSKMDSGNDSLRKSILLVDDDKELRTFVRKSLEDKFSIIEASDGLEALKIIEARLPELIISDVMMPKMDGLELCKALKTNPKLSHIPFLLLTARDSLENRLLGAETGADYYMAKPFSIRLLCMTVINIFDKNDKLRLYYLKDYQSEISLTINNVKDNEFINELLLKLEDMLEDTELNISILSDAMGISQSKLYKRLKEITGYNINEFIRMLRLKKAVYIMEHEDVNINEVMFRVGISSASYFTKIFVKTYGKTPSQFLKELRNRLDE